MISMPIPLFLIWSLVLVIGSPVAFNILWRWFVGSN